MESIPAIAATRTLPRSDAYTRLHQPTAKQEEASDLHTHKSTTRAARSEELERPAGCVAMREVIAGSQLTRWHVSPHDSRQLVRFTLPLLGCSCACSRVSSRKLDTHSGRQVAVSLTGTCESVSSDERCTKLRPFKNTWLRSTCSSFDSPQPA